LRFEVHEVGGEWVVRDGQQELARFPEQLLALQDVARRFGRTDRDGAASLRLNYAQRAATGYLR